MKDSKLEIHYCLCNDLLSKLPLRKANEELHSRYLKISVIDKALIITSPWAIFILKRLTCKQKFAATYELSSISMIGERLRLFSV